MDNSISSQYVFISYKSEEKHLADKIKSFLEQNGFKWWMAPDSLDQLGTQDYSADIFSAIRKCTCLIFAVSPSSLSSKWVNREVRYANDECEKPIIPFVVAHIPEEMQEKNPLFIILKLEKQILNSTCTWDMDVVIPYLNKAFGRSGRVTNPLALASKEVTGQQGNHKLSNARIESNEGIKQTIPLAASTNNRQRSVKHESIAYGYPKVFISYSRRDALDVKRIVDEIQRVGIQCWMDTEEIGEDGDFQKVLINAIDASNVVLFFLSAQSQRSEFVVKEIHYARQKQKRVIIVRINNDPLTDVFLFDFGDVDIVDWRINEQKDKLLRDVKDLVRPSTLGECLRNARIAKGYSVEQVAARTRMLVSVINDLENDDFRAIKAALYGKGFIRLYAECVGINPGPLIKRFLAEYSMQRLE